MQQDIIIYDFDDTWSRDREAFKLVRKTFENVGFKSVLCTARSACDPTNYAIFLDWNEDDVIFTEGAQKREFLDSINFPVNQIAFFIDDTPESIPYN